MDSGDIARALTRMAHEIVERNRSAADLLILGIPTRGVALADRIGGLVETIAAEPVAVGALDVSPYRDDLDPRSRAGEPSSDVPVPVDDVTVVLVDDVLFTGRTVRAALDALVDLGRPGSVQLAALVDRGHRELPLRPDYVGKNVPTALTEHVSVRVVEVDGEDGVWIRAGEERSGV